MEYYNKFADFEMDVLKEIGNIGAGHAATALSKLLNKQVNMQIPKVRFIPFEEISESVGGSEKIVIAIFLRVVGDAPGNMFFIMDQKSAHRLLEKLVGMKVGSEDDYSELEISALNEIGNILAGSYLSSLADFTNLNMSPSTPALAVDMAGAILSDGVMQYGQMGDQALIIDTKFLEDEYVVDGYFFLIPDPNSLEKILEALGVSPE